MKETRRNRHQNEGREVRKHGTTTGYRYGCRCGPCSQAKARANAKRVYGPGGLRWTGWVDREAERTMAESAAASRAVQYEQAAATATGELAELVRAQAADARLYRVWSVSFDVAQAFTEQIENWRDPGFFDEWDDPTADAALARLAA